MSDTNHDVQTSTLAETENYIIWKSEEADGETTYHIELDSVTLHFFEEEWKELLKLVASVK